MNSSLPMRAVACSYRGGGRLSLMYGDTQLPSTTTSVTDRLLGAGRPPPAAAGAGGAAGGASPAAAAGAPSAVPLAVGAPTPDAWCWAHQSGTSSSSVRT